MREEELKGEWTAIVEGIRSKGDWLTCSGTSQQLNSIDHDTIMPIPHIIELGLLDLLLRYKVLELRDRNRIYHW